MNPIFDVIINVSSLMQLFFSLTNLFLLKARTFDLPHTIAATTVAHLSAILIRNYVNPVQTSFFRCLPWKPVWPQCESSFTTLPVWCDALTGTAQAVTPLFPALVSSSRKKMVKTVKKDPSLGNYERRRTNTCELRAPLSSRVIKTINQTVRKRILTPWTTLLLGVTNVAN